MATEEDTPKVTHHYLAIAATADASQIRTADFGGDEHLVVPMVILVEGVIHPSNAVSPELALAEEFGRHPQGWDGRPVVLGHPVRNGTPVSANSPGVLEDESFGQLFNTRLEDGKLKTEAWINNARVDSLGEEFKAAVERIQNADETTEVSTGLFVSLEASEGVFEGEKFNSIWRNVVPDHLAILPEGVIGACSVEDGCGAPRVNGATSSLGWANNAGAYMLSSRDSLITNMREGEATVACDACKNNAEVQSGLFKQLFGVLGEKLGFKANAETLSDVDTRRALESALSEEDPNSFFFLVAVFNGMFVYEEGFSSSLTQRSFSIDEGGMVSLSDDKMTVRPVTEFVPVQTDIETPQEEETMSNAQRVQALIDNQATRFNEESREWLTALSDEQLEILEPITIEAEVTPVEEVVDNEEAEVTPVEEAPVAAPTVDEYVSTAPPEIQEVLKEGIKMQQDRRTSLIGSITSCSRNKFDAKTLEGFDLATLEKLASLADAPNYSGQGAGGEGTGTLRDQSSGNEVPAAPLVFEPRSVA